MFRDINNALKEFKNAPESADKNNIIDLFVDYLWEDCDKKNILVNKLSDIINHLQKVYLEQKVISEELKTAVTNYPSIKKLLPMIQRVTLGL